MGTCGQPGYVFRDFCLEQGIEFIIFCLNQSIDLSIFVLNWVKCLKQGIKNRNSVLKRVGKSAIFVLRTFAPIVSAHPYCARKCTRHVIHERAR